MDVVVEQVREFVEAQLESFEASTSGYMFWSWAGRTPSPSPTWIANLRKLTTLGSR